METKEDATERRLRAKMLRYSYGLSSAVDELLLLLRRYGLGALPPEADGMLGERPLTPVTAVELAVRLVVNDSLRRLGNVAAEQVAADARKQPRRGYRLNAEGRWEAVPETPSEGRRLKDILL